MSLPYIDAAAHSDSGVGPKQLDCSRGRILVDVKTQTKIPTSWLAEKLEFL